MYLQDSNVNTNYGETYVPNLEMDLILADPSFNCRGEDISPASIADLAEDIRKDGLISPILVQPLDGHPKYKFSVIAGHRRHTACKFLGLKSIKALVRTGLTEKQSYVINLKENVKRLQLNITQEAQAVHRLLGLGMNDKEIRAELDVSYPWLKVRKELLSLPAEVREDAANGNLSQAHITELSKMSETKSKEDVIRAAAKIRDRKLKVDKTFDKTDSSEEKEAKAVQNEAGLKFRSHDEIDRMQNLLIDLFKGPNIAARALAWSRYIITDAEFFGDIKTEAGYMGMPFEPPEDWNE